MLVHDEKDQSFAYKNPYVTKIKYAFTLSRRADEPLSGMATVLDHRGSLHYCLILIITRHPPNPVWNGQIRLTKN
jgi:hypothetical protein